MGSLKNDSFTYNNKTYSLNRHGFARDRNFDIIESSENKAIFSLKYDEETLKLYPFDFELQLIYTLNDNNLKDCQSMGDIVEAVINFTLRNYNDSLTGK